MDEMREQITRARAAIAAIAADRNAIDASDALQGIGARVMREIESLSTEVAIQRAATRTTRRNRDAR